MDENDKQKIGDEIDRLKIGKKDEKLVGWDHIRKQKEPKTNLPPMRARGADEKYNYPSPKPTHGGGWFWFWFILLLVAIGIIIAKLIRLW